jgi:acyl-ACP thioesterase
LNIVEHRDSDVLRGAHLRQRFRAPFHHADPTGSVGIAPLAAYLQQAAGEHAEALGVGSEHLTHDALFWVLTSLFIRVDRAPRGGENVEIDTWPSQRPRQLYQRDFRIRDEGGAEIVAATSSWALIDQTSRKAVRGPAWIAPLIHVDATRAAVFPDRSPPRLAHDERACEVTPRWSDLDINGHVNNANLIGWLLEVFEADWLTGHALSALHIVFRAECVRTDTVRSCMVRGEAGRFAHVLRRGDGAEIARAQTWWRERPS